MAKAGNNPNLQKQIEDTVSIIPSLQYGLGLRKFVSIHETYEMNVPKKTKM